MVKLRLEFYDWATRDIGKGNIFNVIFFEEVSVDGARLPKELYRGRILDNFEHFQQALKIFDEKYGLELKRIIVGGKNYQPRFFYKIGKNSPSGEKVIDVGRDIENILKKGCKSSYIPKLEGRAVIPYSNSSVN